MTAVFLPWLGWNPDDAPGKHFADQLSTPKYLRNLQTAPLALIKMLSLCHQLLVLITNTSAKG